MVATARPTVLAGAVVVLARLVVTPQEPLVVPVV